MSRSLRIAAIVGLAVLTGGAAEVAAQGNWQPGDFGALRLRLGLFEPDGDSRYFDDKALDWTGEPEDLEDAAAGMDYLWRYGRSSGLLFGIGFWEGEMTQAYRDFVDQGGMEISHLTSLETAELSVAWSYRFGDGAGLTPYIGAGGGFLWWRLREDGDFIDFGDPGLPINRSFFEAEGWTTHYLLLAGAEVPMGSSWSFFAEGRWRTADDDLGDDFAGFGEIDLSGREISAGVSFNF